MKIWLCYVMFQVMLKNLYSVDEQSLIMGYVCNNYVLLIWFDVCLGSIHASAIGEYLAWHI